MGGKRTLADGRRPSLSFLGHRTHGNSSDETVPSCADIRSLAFSQGSGGLSYESRTKRETVSRHEGGREGNLGGRNVLSRSHSGYPDEKHEVVE